MAHDAIPAGGGFADGVAFLSSADTFKAGVKSAIEWTRSAIGLVREAAEPNPWREATDEDTAGELLRRSRQWELGDENTGKTRTLCTKMLQGLPWRITEALCFQPSIGCGGSDLN
jgi:hypothetical protein